MGDDTPISPSLPLSTNGRGFDNDNVVVDNNGDNSIFDDDLHNTLSNGDDHEPRSLHSGTHLGNLLRIPFSRSSRAKSLIDQNTPEPLSTT